MPRFTASGPKQPEGRGISKAPSTPVTGAHLRASPSRSPAALSTPGLLAGPQPLTTRESKQLFLSLRPPKRLGFAMFEATVQTAKEHTPSLVPIKILITDCQAKVINYPAGEQVTGEKSPSPPATSPAAVQLLDTPQARPRELGWAGLCSQQKHRTATDAASHARPSRGASPGRREACGDPEAGPRRPGPATGEPRRRVPAAAVPRLASGSGQRAAAPRCPRRPCSPGRGYARRPRRPSAPPRLAPGGGPAALPARPRSPGSAGAPPPAARQPRPPAERPRPPPHLGSGGRRRGRR